MGNSATEIDSSEGNNIAEDANLLVGQSYGSIGDPLANHVVSVSTTDVGGQAGALDTDQTSSSDQVSYDVGSGPQVAVMDGVGVYNATITYMDGSSTTISAVLFQDSTGNLFLAPEVSANADSAAMEAMGMRSLSLDSLITNDASLTQDRYLTAFPCIAQGMRIATPEGLRPVEALAIGDLVTTLDHGAQPIIWRSARHLDLKALHMAPQKPVEIKPGALGSGAPAHRLVLSPQHRVFVRNGPQEHLAPAKGLTGLPGVRLMKGCRSVTYHTILTERHEILFAEGLPVESFYPGPIGLASLTPMERLQLLVRVPGAGGDVRKGYGLPARPLLTRRQSADWAAQKGLAGLPAER